MQNLELIIHSVYLLDPLKFELLDLTLTTLLIYKKVSSFISILIFENLVKMSLLLTFLL
jgi:hypothetical protein